MEISARLSDWATDFFGRADSKLSGAEAKYSQLRSAVQPGGGRVQQGRESTATRNLSQTDEDLGPSEESYQTVSRVVIVVSSVLVVLLGVLAFYFFKMRGRTRHVNLRKLRKSLSVTHTVNIQLINMDIIRSTTSPERIHPKPQSPSNGLVTEQQEIHNFAA